MNIVADFPDDRPGSYGSPQRYPKARKELNMAKTMTAAAVKNYRPGRKRIAHDRWPLV